MRWRVFAWIRKRWKFIDAFDMERDANELVRSYQDAGYKAFTTNKQQMNRNPRRKTISTTDDVAKANRLYKRFTGKNPPAARKIQIPSFTKAGVVFGTLFGVGYISERDGKPYQHTFRTKSRPLLIASSDGKSVLIVGGRFAFTERGIVDR